MIHVERGPSPRILNSAGVKARLKSTAKFFSIPVEQRRQQRYKFYPVILFESVRYTLAKAFYKKCAYCESPVDVSTG